MYSRLEFGIGKVMYICFWFDVGIKSWSFGEPLYANLGSASGFLRNPELHVFLPQVLLTDLHHHIKYVKECRI